MGINKLTFGRKLLFFSIGFAILTFTISHIILMGASAVAGYDILYYYEAFLFSVINAILGLIGSIFVFIGWKAETSE